MFAGWKPALPGFARPEVAPPNRLDQHRDTTKLATGIGNWQHFHIGNISLRVIILTQRRRAAESGTAPPGSAGILPAAFAGWKPALPGFVRPEAASPSRIDQRRRHPIGNWNWQLATFPHWQH